MHSGARVRRSPGLRRRPGRCRPGTPPRYTKEHKVKAKEAILRSASRVLKRDGFKGIGVDGLAASAQVTSGGFYSNFATKEALLEEVISAELGAMFAGIADADSSERGQRLRELVTVYLSDDHCQGVADGCVMPSLSAEVSRAGAPARETYRLRMTELVSVLASAMEATPTNGSGTPGPRWPPSSGRSRSPARCPPGDEARAVLDAAFTVMGMVRALPEG
jgi:TetR/AcrR family transcriptional regulator, transcriptional repressor for nem operon